MVLIYVSLSEKHIAEQVAEFLLKERLANHINILPKISCMLFDEDSGEVKHSRETVLLIKTKALLYRTIEKKLEEMHLPSHPKIFSMPITQISEGYYALLTQGIQRV